MTEERSEAAVTRLVAPSAAVSISTPEPTAPSQVLLTWKDLTYHVSGPTGAGKTILHSTSGYVQGGDMLAILGPSGAGKTTLLDVLAQRKSGGGEVRLNAAPIHPSALRRMSGYVQQENYMHSYVTVKENITFVAKLRTPPSVTDTEIGSRVHRVMQLLGIDHIQDRYIGGPTVTAISGGEKKRCAVAGELVTGPTILFLDEPTTGLDTFTAQHLLSVLRSLAASGMAVIFSIHQPRASIYSMFDKVLLLNGVGEEAFFGTAADALPFLKSIGVAGDCVENPADFLLDAVSSLETDEQLLMAHHPDLQVTGNGSPFYMPPPTQAGDVAAAFRAMKLPMILAEIDTLLTQVPASDLSNAESEAQSSSPYFRGAGTQVLTVAARCYRNKLRDPIATVVSISVAMLFAVLIGSMYFRLGTSQDSIRNRMGALFFIAMNTTFSSLGSLELFLMDRSIYSREHRSGMYSAGAYYTGKILQDVPVGIVVNMAFSAVVYGMIGLQWDLQKFLLFALMGVLLMLNSYFMCLLVSNVSKNYAVANIVASLTLVLYLLPTGGMLISLDSIPLPWRWLKYVSFVRYGFAALVASEFDGLVLTCGSEDVGVPCNTCGAAYAESQGFHVKEMPLYVGLTAGSIAVYLLLGYVALRVLRPQECK